MKKNLFVSAICLSLISASFVNAGWDTLSWGKKVDRTAVVTPAPVVVQAPVATVDAGVVQVGNTVQVSQGFNFKAHLNDFDKKFCAVVCKYPKTAIFAAIIAGALLDQAFGYWHVDTDVDTL
jgi:hypothetical protein